MKPRSRSRAVDYLVDKHETAVKRLADAQAYLTAVELSIADQSLITKWRQEHDKWETDVLDVTNHGNMDAPFEVSNQTCELLRRLIAWSSTEIKP